MSQYGTVTVKEVAQALGVDEPKLVQWLNTYQISFNQGTFSVHLLSRAIIRSTGRGGTTVKEAAQTLGIGERTLSDWLARYGIFLLLNHDFPWIGPGTQEEIEEATSRTSGKGYVTMKDAALTLGLDEVMIEKWIDERILAPEFDPYPEVKLVNIESLRSLICPSFGSWSWEKDRVTIRDAAHILGVHEGLIAQWYMTTLWPVKWNLDPRIWLVSLKEIRTALSQPNGKEWVTIREASRTLGLDEAQLTRWLHEGHIPSQRSQLEQFIVLVNLEELRTALSRPHGREWITLKDAANTLGTLESYLQYDLDRYNISSRQSELDPALRLVNLEEIRTAYRSAGVLLLEWPSIIRP